jgi:SAM-dependent methyltransferase
MDAKDPIDRWNDPRYVRAYIAFTRTVEFDGQEWAQKLEVCEKDVVVDLGCGEAKLLRALAPFISLGIGFDGSSIALEHGRSLRDAKIENIELRQADFRNLILPMGGVSAIVSMWAFHHIPDDEKFKLFRKIKDALIPGGLFYLEDDSFNFGRDQFAQMVPAMYAEFEARFGSKAWEILKKDLDGEDFEYTPYLEDVLSMIGVTGFEIDSVTKLGLNGVLLRARRPKVA